jgi:nitroimidazol reductase NimA-like FMN-containing flavoprotein (pyridoxamine 5'-phosphate oxidase superfamily)
VLSHPDCVNLLSTTNVARIVFVVDGWPVSLPVNYAMDGDDIVFRTAPGVKLSAARCEGQVAVEVDGADQRYNSGWSVLVYGLANEVTDPEEVARLEHAKLVPWARGDRRSWVRIRPTQVTGRRVPPNLRRVP